MEKTAQLKASVVNSAMSYTSRTLGEPALKSILASFDSKEISTKRLPSDWVPEKTYRDYLVATRRYLESSAPEKRPKDFFFDMGKSIAGEGINKYYKSLIKMFDMTFMLTKSPMIWGVTHSHGSLTVEPIGQDRRLCLLDRLPGPQQGVLYHDVRVHVCCG